MDPQATIVLLLESIAERNFEAAQEALDNLTDWSAIGGYIPESIHKALDALR